MPIFTGWDIVRRPVVDGLAGAIAVAHQLPSTVAGPFHAAARDAFSTGMDIVAVVGAGILLVGGVTTTSLLRAGRGGQDVVGLVNREPRCDDRGPGRRFPERRTPAWEIWANGSDDVTSTAAGRPRSNGRLPAMAGSVPGAMVNAAPRAPEMTLLRRHVSSADRFLLAPPPVPRTPRFAAEVAAVALVPALLLGVLFGAPAFWAWLVLLVVAGVASPFALRAWRERHSGDIVRVPPTRLGRHLAALLPHAEQAFEVLDRYPGARTRELSRLLDQALLDFALDTVRVHEASVGVETLLDRILEHRRTHLITDHPVTRDALRVFADADAVLAESARKLWRAIDRVIDATLISTPEAVADAGQHLEATLEGLQVADLAISTDARQTLSMVAGMEGYDPPASGGAAPQSVTGPDGNREPRRIDLTKPDDRLVP